MGKVAAILSSASTSHDVSDIVSDISISASFAKSHSPRHLDLKIDVSFGKESGNASVCATPALSDLGKVELTETDINGPQSWFVIGLRYLFTKRGGCPI